MLLDCAIIGGGPAGMSASLVLGRAERNIILFDQNKPRNAVTRLSHGFLTRDGVSPAEFRRIAQNELRTYPAVSLRETKVIVVEKADRLFRIRTLEGESHIARTVLFATGIKEVLPPIEGMAALYGSSLYSCPYCDGWELKDKTLAIISDHKAVFKLIKLVYNWSKRLIVCTNGRRMENETRVELAKRNIAVYEQKITRLTGKGGMIDTIIFEDGGEAAAVEGGFITPEWLPNNTLAQSLGCELDKHGGLNTDALGRTNIKGVYAAGDITTPSQLIIAAAEGSRAAMGVNVDLAEMDF
ncbi:MAG: NAD(P)/FAD-dependent oxidoreductase [Bacillus sp. (in: firmicutes)]